MQYKRILLTIVIWGFIAGFPVISGQAILTYIETLLGGFLNPLLGSGFTQFAPVVVDGASFAVIFFALDKVGATKTYSVQV